METTTEIFDQVVPDYRDFLSLSKRGDPRSSEKVFNEETSVEAVVSGEEVVA